MKISKDEAVKLEAILYVLKKSKWPELEGNQNIAASEYAAWLWGEIKKAKAEPEKDDPDKKPEKKKGKKK